MLGMGLIPSVRSPVARPCFASASDAGRLPVQLDIFLLLIGRKRYGQTPTSSLVG